MKGFNDEAKSILMKASSINKTKMSEVSLHQLNERIEMKEAEEAAARTSAQTDVAKTWTLKVVLQVLNISYLWFATIFVYYGFNINAVYLDFFSKYVSFIVSQEPKRCHCCEANFIIFHRLSVWLKFPAILLPTTSWTSLVGRKRYS